MSYKEEQGLDKQFNSQDIENRCDAYWSKNEIYKYDASQPRDNTFIVDTPPPTVSGSLHIGHIFSYTQTDIIARYQRMQGKSVFYPIGWDDNGLPTERRVQNYYNITCNPKVAYNPDFKPVHIENNKEDLVEISRKNFIEACETLTEEDEKIFENVFRRAGHSYDWNLKYSTISPQSIKISQASFLDLYKKGKVKAVEAPIMWDVTFKSAVSQAEVEDREKEGYFHDIRFSVKDSDETFIIATTRPEFLSACLAIVAHPDDERYKHLFGKTAIVPLFDIPVPIVPSEHAEKDKGTGIMMVCTFGDAADVAWWKKSGLPIKQIIGLDGKIMNITYGEGAFTTLNKEKAQKNFNQLIGLPAHVAKKKVAEMLKEEGYLVNEPKKIMHPVKFYEKGTLPLEFVSSRQWFVSLMDMKQEMLSAGRKIDWLPAYMQHRYETWTEGLNQDWCISRQRYFGVPFPVWYKVDANGNIDYNHVILPNENDLPIDPMADTPNGYTEAQRNQPNGFAGDNDVMDTWATSALTPQIAMSMAEDKTNLSMPFDVRPQAHDIIRTWAFYTIAKSLIHENTIPWYKTLISGFILDPDRKKMSKSKGNVVTPMNLIENHSADAVRYWAAKAKLGADTAFEEKMMQQGRKLVVKMYNASKFVFMIVGDSKSANYTKDITNTLDKSWIKKISETYKSAKQSFENYDYSLALDAIETRFWDFCDNYVEIVKKRAYSEDNASAIATLKLSLDSFIKLLAPFCPFITEEIYQARPWKQAGEISVHKELWNSLADLAEYAADNALLYDTVSAVSTEIRKQKTIENKSQKNPVLSLIVKANNETVNTLKTNDADLINVGNIVENGIKYELSDDLVIENIVLDQNFVPEKKKKVC